MVFDFIARLFRKRKPDAQPAPERVAVQVGAEGLSAPLPSGQMACVFRGDLLIDVRRDQSPKTLAAGQTCWLVPVEDVPLELSLPLGEQPVQAQVAVRFEPESLLGKLLENRSDLTKEDLSALTTSELVGLLDLLGQRKAEELLTLDDTSRERLRAKLSLLLQTKGLRCTGLEPLRLAPVAAVAPAQITSPLLKEELQQPKESATPVAGAVPVPAESASAPPPVRDEELGRQAEQELVRNVEDLRTDADWEKFLAGLEQAGFAANEAEAVELDQLGERLIDRQLNAAQVAGRIRTMAETAAERAGVVTPDLRHWNGLALRLRVMETAAPAAAAAADAPATGPGVRLTATKRPWTWWMLRRRSVDARLQQFLRETLQQTRTSLQQYRRGLSELRQSSRIRELDEWLRLGEDLLSMVPSLTAPHRQLRPDGQRVKELVHSMERAVTAAEMLQAQARAVLAAPAGSAAWNEALMETRSALDALTDHLRARHAVRPC